MKTLMYITELPSMNKKLVEATRKQREEAKAYRASMAAEPPKPLGPPEETPPQPSPSAPPEAPTATSEAPPPPPDRKPGVSYPDEVKNADGSTNSFKEPGVGLSAPVGRDKTADAGWTGSVQDKADKASGADQNSQDKPAPKKEELGLFTKAILGSIGYRVLGQVSSAMDATEKQRTEPSGYTGAGTR